MVVMVAALCQHTAFVGGDHVLDIDERILATMDLEELKALLDQIANILSLSLAVVNAIVQVHVHALEQVELKVVDHVESATYLQVVLLGEQHREQQLFPTRKRVQYRP